MKILIVDDLEENIYLLETLLKGSGHKVVTAKDGAEALAKLKENPIDIIISDILMPKMDGFQLCRKCKKDNILKKIPFIFYTATYTDKKDEEFALSLGAEKFIVKPQEPEVFLKILKEVIEEYGKGILIATKEPIKEEEIYFTKYNKRLIHKLEKKMLDLEKSEERIKYLYSVLRAIRGVNQLIVREKNRDILIQKTCDILIRVRGYATAWLGLLKDEKTFAMVVGSPLGADVSRFCAQVLRGDHPPCIKKALTKKDLFMVMDRSRDCGDCSLCSLKKLHLGRNSLLIRITHKSKLFGFLVLSLEPDVCIDQEEKGLLEEVTSDIAFGLYNIELDENLGKRTHELKERVKELNCLWEISNLVEKPDISQEAIIKGTVNLLPSTWQYPQITCARIILEAKEYKTKNFKETIWKQANDIILHKKPIGTIEVYYLEERPEMDEGPFLKEERNLITIIAERLGKIIEKKQSEEEIQLHAAMMDNVAEGVYLIGLDDLLIKWTNEKFTRMFGYDPGELVGKQVDIVNAPTERTPAETRISIVDVLKETGECHGEVRNIKRDGTHFWCYANVSLFDHPEYGKVIVSVHTDITERKQAEDKLLKNQYYLTKAQEMGIIGTWELDIQKNTLIWTDENYIIFGVPLGTEMTYELFINCIHPDDRDYVNERWSAGLNHEPYDIEHRLIVNDKVKWVREKADIEFDKEGNPTIAIGFSQDITERKQAEEKLKKTLDATIETVSKIVEIKDPYTAGHQQRVSQLATAIAKELNLPPDKVEGIRIASLIHDIGKISVPTEILSKTTTLSDIEFSLIKGHSQAGSDILKAIDFFYPVAQIVLQHHERLDGSGYPNNLKGDKILLEARILGVADVVEAMSSHRPYRPSLGIDAALEEITQNRGTLYDPEIVDVCLRFFKKKGFKFE